MMVITGQTCEWSKSTSVAMGKDIVSLLLIPQIITFRYSHIFVTVTYSPGTPLLSPQFTNNGKCALL